MRNNYLVPTLIAVGISLAGCGSMPEKNLALDEARSSYSTAQSNPDVTKHAAVELQQAEKAMEIAENAWSKNEDAALVDHLAYLAKQRAAIAQNTGILKASELAIANTGTERDKVRLEARTAEADAAHKQVEAAQKTAEQKAADVAAANVVSDSNKLRQEADSAAAAKQAADDLATANEKLGQMETKLTELNAKKTKRGLVITLGDVLFDTNKAELKSGANRNVQKIADFLKEYPERKAIIEGFTDNTGSNSHNQELSEQRAKAVRAFLIENGIDGNRVAARGYGEANPVVNNNTPASRQRNRRVEIVLSDDM